MREDISRLTEHPEHGDRIDDDVAPPRLAFERVTFRPRRIKRLPDTDKSRRDLLLEPLAGGEDLLFRPIELWWHTPDGLFRPLDLVPRGDQAKIDLTAATPKPATHFALPSPRGFKRPAAGG